MCNIKQRKFKNSSPLAAVFNFLLLTVSDFVDEFQTVFLVIAADAECRVFSFEAQNIYICFLAAEVDFSVDIFDFPPTGGEGFAEEFDITFSSRPMHIKIGGGVDFCFFAFGKFVQYGRARFAGKVFTVEAYLFFPHGECCKPFAVAEVEMNFSAFYVRFAVNCFTNRRI